MSPLSDKTFSTLGNSVTAQFTNRGTRRTQNGSRLRCHTQTIIIVYIVPLMHPDKTQTRHMHIGQFNRLRINQHLVCTNGREIFILENKRCVRQSSHIGRSKYGRFNRSGVLMMLCSKTCSGRTDGGSETCNPHCDRRRLANAALDLKLRRD